MPGGVWAQQIRAGSVGGYGVQAPKPASPFDTANQYLRGGGSSSDFGRGINAVVKRQFADVGKANINLLDPLAMSRGATNYQPVDGEDGGPLGIGNYYNPQQPGGLFAGLFGGIAQTVGGIFGEEAAKTGSDIGTILGKTVEAPLAIVGSAGMPFVAPVIDSVNSEIEKVTPYILRDTLKIPTNVGGAFQSMLNVFGLAGMAVERTYAGMDARGALPPDIEARLASGELKSRDEAFDEMVLTSRGYSNDVLHNLAWNLLLDPANWASLGVGAVGGAVKGTGALARTFGTAVRADAALAEKAIAQGGRLAEVTQAALAREAVTGMVDSRGLIAQMRNVIDDSGAPFHLSYVERLGMSALGPVSPEVGSAVAKVGQYVLRATDPVNFFSGSKAGQRSMAFLTTAASTGAIAAYKPTVVLNLAKMADRIGGGGSERVYRSIGINGANAMQEQVLSDLASDAMQKGAIPRTGKLSPTEAVRELLRGGAYDSNIGKYIELQVERNKDISVGMLPPQQMYDETVNKFAAILGVDSNEVRAVMKTVSSDDAILVHALYYYTKGEALHTTVLHALRDSKVAGKLNSIIDPERVAIISSRTLTNRTVKAVDDALAKGNVAALRQEMEKYNDFNWVHNKNVPDSELRDEVERWLDTNRPHLVQEVDLFDPVTGQPLANIPDELRMWAQDGETFGYKLGQKMPGEVPEDALWRVTRAPGADGEILNANPYSEFWVEGGDSAKRLNRFSATRMAMTRGIRQERIIWSQRRRFITDMAKGSEDGGVDIPPALGDRIFKALMYEAKNRYIQPRGMEPQEMYSTARRVLDDARRDNAAYGNLATKLTERQVVLTLLRATQGEVALVGVTQKVTGGIKAYAPGSGANYWGRISERLYPLMRFTLNPVFQTMELTEPYILNSMRGIWTPLKRDSPVYQEALATRNAITQMVHHGLDNPDGLAAETAEALATQAYQGSEATAKFGRNRFMRWMPHIGERKDVAAAMETERIMGDHMYIAFQQILGPKFEAYWGDMERNFGTNNRGKIAKRWMAANFALQDVNGFEVATVDDILKMKTVGKRFRLNKNGDRGAYTFGDVERIFDHVRSYDGAWTQGLRSERGLEAGEALLEDLRNMTREEWWEEVDRSGLNADGITRLTQQSADDIWHMANGPELDEFWNGRKTPSGRKDGYRQTMLGGVTGTDAVYTRLARDQEIMHARAIVRAVAAGKGMTEEEFVKLHFEDIPRELGRLQDIEGGSLQEIRESWASEALRRRANKTNPEDAYEMVMAGGTPDVDARIGSSHPTYRHLEETANGGQHYFLKMHGSNFTDWEENLAFGGDYFYDLPNKGYMDQTALLQDIRQDNVIVRVRRDAVTSEGYWGDGVDLLDRSSVHPSKWEVLTPDGWKPLQGGEATKVSPARAPRMENPELSVGRDLYSHNPADPLSAESGIAKVDVDEILMNTSEKVARTDYVGIGHKAINAWWRGWSLDYGNLSDADARVISGNLDKAVAKGQLDKPMTLFRGVDITDVNENGYDLHIDYENLGVDDIFSDDAYFSTSATPHVAHGFAGTGQGWQSADHVGVILQIEAPAGSHVALILHEAQEDEYLFGRGVRWRVKSKRVNQTSSGREIYLTVEPVSVPAAHGVSRLALGEAPGRLRNEGRLLQDVTQSPAAARDQIPVLGEYNSDGLPYTAEEITDIRDNIERAIERAEAAKPPEGRVSVAGHTFGRREPGEVIDEILDVLDDEEITAAGNALADLRTRMQRVAESEVEDWNSGPHATRREIKNSNDRRLLAPMASAIAATGGFRFGLRKVLEVMEKVWARGPVAVTDAAATPLERDIASHVVRGAVYGIEQPIYGNRANDTLDAISNNTSRRQTGRVDDIQPIVADDLSAEAAGYLTQSAYDDLVGQDLIVGGQPRPAAIPSTPPIPPGPTTYVRELKGTTGPVLVEDPATGLRYVEKRGATPGHAAEELAADKAYMAAGVPVPKAEMVDGVKRAEYIEGTTSLDDFWDTASDAERTVMKEKLQQHFALDALLANWDVIGLEGDNILIKNGVPYRIDNGGALRFRAQGAPKGGAFGPEVSEIQRMRGGGNEWQQRIFGDLPDAEVRRQILDLGPRLDDIIAGLPPELAAVVRQRYDDMLRQTEDWVPAPERLLPTQEAVPTLPAPVKVGEYEHEYLVDFYNKAARIANERGLNGRATWTAADIAQVASLARERLGRRGGRAITGEEFYRAFSEIQMAVTPGEGMEEFTPLFEILGQKRYRAERTRVMRAGNLQLHKDLRDRLGIIIESGEDMAVGLFDGEAPTAFFSAQVLATPEMAETAREVLAYAAGQRSVRSWRLGPSLQDINSSNAIRSYTPRVSIYIPPADLTPRMAEQIAEAIGTAWPDVGDVTAVRGANGSWHLQIMDADGTLFPRLDSGHVDEGALNELLTDIIAGDDAAFQRITNAKVEMAVEYGHLDETAPPRTAEGTIDWGRYAEDIEARSTARGAPVRASELRDIRTAYHLEIKDALRREAPDQYERILGNRPVAGRNLEDRRGGDVLGITSPRGVSSAVIRGFAAADALTGLHELIHVFSIGAADPSLREVVSKAYDQYNVANDAAKAAKLAILRQKVTATANPSLKTKYKNQIVALQHDLQNPHPTEWGNAQEEFFVHMVYEWIARGVPDNPELGNAMEHFRNWLAVTKKELSGPGMVPIEMSPEMEATLSRMFSRKGVDTVSYSVEQQTLRMAGQQMVRGAWDEAHATHFYRRDRGMAERSINHPYIGLYPASYMWGKILPEMLRFLALRPFGMETPFLAWNVAREVSDSVRAQGELDPGFKDWLDGNEDAFMLFSMLFPGLPHDIPANASLPVRRIAEQGLEAQKAYASGVNPEDIKDIDFTKGSQDAIQYALGPLGSIRTATEVVGMGGDLVRSTIGSAQETFAGQEPLEGLPLR